MPKSDPPVRGGAFIGSGKHQAFTMKVHGEPIKVRTGPGNFQIIVTSGLAKFTLPLEKKNWSLTIQKIRRKRARKVSSSYKR